MTQLSALVITVTFIFNILPPRRSKEVRRGHEDQHISDRDGRLHAAPLQTSALLRDRCLSAHASSSWLANKRSPCILHVYRPIEHNRPCLFPGRSISETIGRSSPKNTIIVVAVAACSVKGYSPCTLSQPHTPERAHGFLAPQTHAASLNSKN